MILFNVTSHLIIGLIIAAVLWPYLGFAGLVVFLFIAVYLVHAWSNADLKVAGKAGFRRPTLVQRRYLQHLGIGQEVFTHPSPLEAAGTLASSKRRLVLLTTGVFKLYERHELSEKDLRDLITKLSSGDHQAVFGWTFHLATGGSSLFSRKGLSDTSAQWGRRTVLTGVVAGVVVVMLGGLVAAALSPLFGRPLDISPYVPLFWLFLVIPAAFVFWRQINGLLLRTAAAEWNKPITLEKVIFQPMPNATGGHANLDLMKRGLLIAVKRRSTADKADVQTQTADR